MRETRRSLAADNGVTLAALPRVLRRPSDYLSRFAHGTGLERLPVDEQPERAQYFRTDPRLFGQLENWEP